MSDEIQCEICAAYLADPTSLWLHVREFHSGPADEPERYSLAWDRAFGGAA